eukprot:SAG31_NODE_8478_length_1444_cov_1.141264_1_plen_356_part_00
MNATFKAAAARRKNIIGGTGELKQPRGPLTARRLRDGSFLLLFFNNGWKGYSPPTNNTRNPYWLSRGELNDAGDDIVWAEPELALYGRGWDMEHNDPAYDLAYPDIVEDVSGKVFVFEAHEGAMNCNDHAFEKLGGCGAAVHQISPTVLEMLKQQMRQPGDRGYRKPTVTTNGLELEVTVPGSTHSAVHVPSFRSATMGLTIEAWIVVNFSRATNSTVEEVIFDCRDNVTGAGLALLHRSSGRAVLVLDSREDGKPPRRVEFASDAMTTRGAKRNRHHVAAIVDGGPPLVRFVVDGIAHDGGEDRQFGWAFFRPATLAGCSSTRRCRVGPIVERLRMYDRQLLTSDLIANFEAEK